MTVPDPAAIVGRTRESSIVLDRDGRFWHDGALVEHAGLVRAFRRWLEIGPEGRHVLRAGPENWCFLRVEGAAAFVDHVRVEGDRLTLGLWDGTEAAADPDGLWVDGAGVLHCRVRGLDAQLGRHAQIDLGARLEPAPGGGFVLRLGDRLHPVRSGP